MNGFGMISTGGPPAPSRANAIEPSGRWYGISPPPVLITNGRDASDAAAAAEASVIRSFRAVGVSWHDTSTPGANPAEATTFPANRGHPTAPIAMLVGP